MTTRLKVNNYSIGENSRTFQIVQLSGATSGDTKYLKDISIFGSPQSGSLNQLPANTTSGIISGGDIFDIDLYQRKYSPSYGLPLSAHTDMLCVSADTSPIIDFHQVGDYTYNLTSETQNANMWVQNYGVNAEPFSGLIPELTPQNQYVEEKHGIAIYHSDNDAIPCSGTISGEIEKVIDNLSFSFNNNRVDPTVYVYGIISGDGTMGIFIKDMNSDIIDPKFEWPVSGLVYSVGNIDAYGIPFAYILEQDMNIPIEYDPLQDTTSESHDGEWWCNAYKLKNMYNNNWQTEIYERSLLDGIRNYLGIGRDRVSLWLKYKYIRDYDYETKNDPEYIDGREDYIMRPSQRYDMIEAIKGIFKYSGYNNNKSNIFSIEVSNSALNSAITEDFYIEGQLILTADEVRIKMQGLVEAEIRSMMEKITPSHTKLWKIIWKGI